MDGRGGEVAGAFRLAPGLVQSRKILLEHQFAMADDDDGMHIGASELQSGSDGAKARAVRADAFGRAGCPAVVKRDRRATGEVSLAKRHLVRLRQRGGCKEREEGANAEIAQAREAVAHIGHSLPSRLTPAA